MADCCCHHKPKPHNAVITAASRYTCPMHPEVAQDKPGDCPKCGMALEAAGVAPTEDDSELRDMTRRLVVAALLSAPVLILAMAHIAHGSSFARWADGSASRWLQAVSSAVVLFGCGWPFLRRAWQSVLNRSANMFTLIATGTLAAWGCSMAVMIFPRLIASSAVYFESAAAIVTLVLAGQVLELRARRRTGDALRALLDLAPATAWRVNVNGLAEEVPLPDISSGEIVRVKPGGKVPVDGVVIAGRSTLDESTLTGESMPVEVKTGSKVKAGTINQSGSFDMRADAVGSHTMLAQIVGMVAQAQRARAPVQDLADRISAVFVPLVFLSSISAFVAWVAVAHSLPMALTAAVSVLIIACPCAIGLAVPVSIAVGVGRAAGSGVLVRQPAALERMEKADTLCIDKTGTLTGGNPEVVETIIAPGVDSNFFWSLAGAIESLSEHPLAAAITRAAPQLDAERPALQDFKAEPGGGVSGRCDSLFVRAGTPEFAGTDDAPVVPHAGRTRVDVSADGKWLGTFLLEDAVKPSSRVALDALRRDRIRVVMLTGDRETVAERVSRTLGIGEFHAGMKPADKARAVQDLQGQGRRVCMAGDGVNDAPALAVADASIAMGAGSDVAKETADLVLVHGSLDGVVRSFALSRAIMRNVRQNLFLAFAYNAAGIPLAAGVLYPLTGWLLSPMIAGAAMSLSSVSVIGNALRLNRTRIGT